MAPLAGAALIAAAILVAGASGSTLAAGATIKIAAFQFTPSPVTIQAGQTVTWVNRDSVIHIVKGVLGVDGIAFAQSPPIEVGASYTIRLSKVGTFAYTDPQYGFMNGTIVVTKATSTPKPTPKPTAKATPRPTAKPTPRPTAKPTSKPAATSKPGATASARTPASPSSESPTPSEALAVTSGGPEASAGPLNTPAGGGSGNGGLGIALLVLGLAVGLAIGAAVWFANRRRSLMSSRPVPGWSDGGPAVSPTTPAPPDPVVPAVAPRRPAYTPAARRNREQIPTTKPVDLDGIDEDAPLESTRPSPGKGDEGSTEGL